ncbi:MAG: biotin/lipoyl-binding protein, partial [Anaerolineales bacterium]
MKTKFTLTILVLILTAGLLSGCGSVTTGAGNGPGEPLKASGVIEAEEVKIASELPGRIANIQVAEGDRVKAGDLLVTLEDDLLLNQQTQAQAASDAAQAQLASAQTAEDAAAASLQAAEANLEVAKDQYQLVLSQVQEQEGEDRVVDWNESTPAQFDLPAWYF